MNLVNMSRAKQNIKNKKCKQQIAQKQWIKKNKNTKK